MKYFTKYLPVPGEIKEGDVCFYPPFGFGRAIMEFNELCFYKKGSNGRGSLTSPISRNLNDKRPYKQFLCSRDIQVGDSVYGDDGFGNPFHVCQILSNCKELECIKVIGEVSPAAIWVKEGMEFEENDIQYWLEMSGVWFRFNKPKVNGLVRFKCPTCNTFH